MFGDRCSRLVDKVRTGAVAMVGEPSPPSACSRSSLAAAQPARRDAVRGRRLHHGRLLVHLVDFVRQPRGDPRPHRNQYVRRNTPRRFSSASLPRSFSGPAWDGRRGALDLALHAPVTGLSHPLSIIREVHDRGRIHAHRTLWRSRARRPALLTIRLRRRHHRRRRDLPVPDLRQMGRRLPARPTGNGMNYQSIGSGGGIKQITREDRRLRRLRHAAEGRGAREGRPGPVPDRDRRRRAGRATSRASARASSS